MGLVSSTPCLKPASNLWISGLSTPPTKPTVFVLVTLAAATPARYEASLLGEDQGRHVVALDDRVDDAEGDLRVLLGDLVHRGAVGEADTDDGVVALLGQRGQALHLVGVGLALGGLDVGGLVTELLLGLLQAGVRGVVEGLVALAADVVRDGETLVAAALAAALSLVPPQAVAASASDATPTATRVSLDIRRMVKFPILESPAVGAQVRRTVTRVDLREGVRGCYPFVPWPLRP